VRLPRNPAVRRFGVVWTASVLWKLVAFVAFLVLAVKLSVGGGL